MKVRLPAVYVVQEKFERNWIKQMASPAAEIDAEVVKFSFEGIDGFEIKAASLSTPIRLISKAPSQFSPSTQTPLLQYDPSAITENELDVSTGKWLQHPGLAASSSVSYSTLARQAVESWRGSFSYVSEDPERNVIGLRKPQIGALHAVHAHWSVSREVASIVLPTGTGKTETMLGVLTSAACERVIIVVPTHALRTQIAEKFVTLGFLKAAHSTILSEAAHYPVVGVIEHSLKTLDSAQRFFESCNVIVTTSQIAARFSDEVKVKVAELCTHLFIDEAHHAEAPTWRKFKSAFEKRHVLQFTATPFREDDQLIDGKIIYRYSLRQAQQDGYFRPIKFRSVLEFNERKADLAIARATIDELDKDKTNLHIAMARALDIARATEVFAIYEKLGRYNPVILHTDIKPAERKSSLAKLMSGQSRLVVCVDMLGEGFDMPELKIAAFHDTRKSLPVTLQLAGRFTRVRADLGDATFIANRANPNVREELQKLYSQDPDWNELLPSLSDDAIDKQLDAKNFLDGFTPFDGEIPIQDVRPAASMVVYKTRCSVWKPDDFKKGLVGISSKEIVRHTINASERMLVVIVGSGKDVPWTNVEAVQDWEWELLVAIWDKELDLLYVHGSSKSGEYKSFAKALCGEDVELVKDPDLYRCFSGVKRLLLTNLGMNEQFGRQVRYIARMGADVAARLSDAAKKSARRAVISGMGFESGATTTLGATKRGRVWSFQRLRLEQFAKWCKHVGRKVVDEKIDPEEVLNGTLIPKLVPARPDAMPIAIEWPDCIYHDPESAFKLAIDSREPIAFWYLGFELISPNTDGDIIFRVFDDISECRVRLLIEPVEGDAISNYRFESVGASNGTLMKGAKAWSLVEYLDENPPQIYFADGSYLEGNVLVALPNIYSPYERDRIAFWDWQDIDLTKEAQGVNHRPDSVQFRVIETLKKQGGFDIIYDDDGSGESADVVTIKHSVDEKRTSINVDFYHCKYSQADTAGSRVGDLYEVCGQAQKSISWLYNQQRRVELFNHLLRREPKTRKGITSSRYQYGDQDTLTTIRNLSRVAHVTLRVFIVQPGLSRKDASIDQLSLLAVTENFLLDTYNVQFGVIGNC